MAVDHDIAWLKDERKRIKRQLARAARHGVDRPVVVVVDGLGPTRLVRYLPHSTVRPIVAHAMPSLLPAVDAPFAPGSLRVLVVSPVDAALIVEPPGASAEVAGVA